MTRWGQIAVAALAVLATACAGPPPTRARPSSHASVARGQVLAETYCIGCHAIGPTGESHHPLSPPFRTLSRNYPVNALEEAFAEGILVGHPAMPEFRFTESQIDDLVAYLQSIQERQGG